MIALLVPATATAATTDARDSPVRLTATFGDGARLGAATSLNLGMTIVDPLRPAVTEVRILTPPGISFSTSGLGMADCVRTDREVERVINPIKLFPCPGNALIATGSARAELRLDDELRYDGAARLGLYSGGTVADKPGLIIVADTYHPMRAQLTYQGYLYVPSDDFGVGLAMKVPRIPKPPLGAPIALSSFQLTIGGTLRYVRTVAGRRVRYQPDAVPLPRRCPLEGFHFRAIVRFGADERAQDDVYVPCPPAR